MKILVVDDESTSRLIALMALRNLGHESHTARDGADAWDTFQSLRPDVVISDWMMPGMTGLELCRKIRADVTGSYTYFVMVTRHGAQNQILQGMAAGADDYLVKPLDPDDLQARLIAAARVTSLPRPMAHQQLESEGQNDGSVKRSPLPAPGSSASKDQSIPSLDSPSGMTRFCR